MDVKATVWSSPTGHEVVVGTEGKSQAIDIRARPGARGSAVNGGEFLMLALATCFCNDLYREAVRLGLQIDSVEVEARADFEGVGLAATNIRYRAWVSSPESHVAIEELLRVTDAVAEVHNTLRAGVEVARVATD